MADSNSSPLRTSPEKAGTAKDWKVFNDPIHGHITLHPLLVAIIDTPQFQRLRYIKQLGGGYYVFPGASHNRFEHSIGVCYLAGEFVKTLQSKQPELNISPEDVLCVQIAGLCHDLGHGPFSHVFDQKFIKSDWKHENASKDMLDHLIKENNLLPDFEKNNLHEKDLIFIKELIKPPKPVDGNWPCEGRGKDKSFLYEIISNEIYGIDVDKWDYFARDCHCLGIANNFDYKRYMAFAKVMRVDGDRLQICSRDKEAHNLYEMFHTRYTLHRRAYQHKTKVAVEMMITEALKAIDNENFTIPGKDACSYTISEAINDMTAYTLLTDSVFQTIMMLPKEPWLEKAQKIIHKLHTRKHYNYLGRAIMKPSDGKPTEEVVKREILKYKPEGLMLEESDIRIAVVKFDYCMKDNSYDPFQKMWFFRKDKPDEAIRLVGEQVSAMFPKAYKEIQIFLYCEEECDKNKREIAIGCFAEFCDNKKYTCESEGGVGNTPYGTPGRLKRPRSPDKSSGGGEPVSKSRKQLKFFDK